MITNLTDLIGMGGLATGGPEMDAVLTMPFIGLLLVVVTGMLFVLARVALDSREGHSSTSRRTVRVRPIQATA